MLLSLDWLFMVLTIQDVGSVVVGCILVFFLFSMQNQDPQIIIGMRRLINRNKDLLFVVQTILKNFENFSWC